jgi:hypothetical protein
MEGDVELAFRQQMRALALKGGAATKRRFKNDPMHYRAIGALGGRASVAKRRARVTAPPDGVQPQAEPTAPVPTATPVTPYRPSEGLRKRLAMARQHSHAVSTSSILADRLGEELIARRIAQTCYEGSDELEAFDPWQ